MKGFIILIFMLMITSEIFSKSIDTLWQHTLPPKDINNVIVSKDQNYIYHFNDYHFLFEKIDNKYVHYKLPDMSNFYRFTIDGKIIGYDSKKAISVYDCKTRTLDIYDVSFLKILLSGGWLI